MKIIAGLGNFGDKYAYTYHNMGFLAADCIADKLNFRFKKRECDSLTARGFVNGQKVIIAKPLTFMNASGRAVRRLLDENGATAADLIVIYDDVDIEKGKIRVRESGSAGTHNGMRDVVGVLGTTEFARIRIGIGPQDRSRDIYDYVLSEIPQAERPLLAEAVELAAAEVLRRVNGE
ncbi:MAG: aminoacyl-tRNA hydrolase [Clostridiales bacterium]|jgi:PTH1 family peptidyl-tRNA hydrolase|nr:aminoacyl-tRNA hydrolase [Clostridiales bacterium]